MRKYKFLILVYFFCIEVLFAQYASNERNFSEWTNFSTVDTLVFYSRKIKIVYTLKVTNNLKNKFFRKNDSIFNSSRNDFSKMFIYNEHHQLDSISTIPIDNVIIDDSKELIVCLSRAEVSPYHIVIYDFQGNILFKKKISPFEIVLDSMSYIKFKNIFPNFLKYVIEQKQIEKHDNTYYLDLNYWHMLSEEQKSKIKDYNWLQTSRYFKVYPENFDGTLPIELSKYAGFYSQTDPFYEFEMSISNRPTAIILNDEFGRKVKILIPL